MRFRFSPEFQGDAVLKAPNRKKPYRSLDERCSKCQVRGGRDVPCWPSAQPVADNPHGYPCPRREWPDEESAALAPLVSFGAHGESGHLFALAWSLEFGHLPQAEQQRLFRRVVRAHGDPVMRLALWPWLAEEA